MTGHAPGKSLAPGDRPTPGKSLAPGNHPTPGNSPAPEHAPPETRSVSGRIAANTLLTLPARTTASSSRIRRFLAFSRAAT